MDAMESRGLDFSAKNEMVNITSAEKFMNIHIE